MDVPRINLAETPDFDLGGLRVSPARRQVCMAGECRELEPKVAQVLIALASASPAVVSRDRLVEQCWDGRIVGDDALNRCILALRHLAKEFTPEPFAIETIPRIGYSLLAGPGGGAATVPTTGFARPKWAIAALLFLVLVSVLAFGWTRLGASEPASIAVLPFRNLSSGDPYFAEGVGEEIMGQLAREPAFRVAGSASAAQFSGPSDPRKVGRALGVDYILEGSVRPGTDRVRINASLIQTSDGKRLWSETYDRKLDDILEIQSAIGQAVANGLRRQLINSVPGVARPVNGKAYALYLNARGLLRSQNPQSGQDAVTLLREAVRLDPAFAPAWASLADALQLDARTKGNEGMIAVLPKAYDAARHALQLDPNLAEAHGVLAVLLGSESRQAIAHLRRAAELDPRSGQGLMWLSSAQIASGEFDKAIATTRRAHDLDPLWPYPMRGLIDDLAASGDRPAAEAAIRNGFPDDAMTQNFAIGRVARLLGDFSEAARRWSIVANSQSRWAAPSKAGLEKMLFALNLAKSPPEPTRAAIIGGNNFVAAPSIVSAPSPSEWQQHTRSLAAMLVYADDNVLAAKRMLLAGRSRELVATYDGATGLLRIRKGEPVGALRVRDAPIVALALRQQGRLADADDLLRRSDATIRIVYAHGTAPVFFDEDAAGVWAAQGKPGLAINALERAFRRGWLHVGHTDFPKLQNEPAFRSLRGNPRFEALLVKHAAHFAKERAETARALKIRV